MKYFSLTKIAFFLLMFLLLTPAISLVTAASSTPKVNGKIAFSSDRDGNYEIYVMNPDGSGQTRLTTNNSKEEHPNWSPDGTKIAFSSNSDGNWEIYVMNSNGSGQTNLTKNYAADEQPSFSPDGTKITFTSNRDGNNEIYVMNSDSSGQMRLTNNNTNDERPSWSLTVLRLPSSTNATVIEKST